MLKEERQSGTFNQSASFKVNYSEDIHIVRCTISSSSISGYCASEAGAYNNDDVNFTVTDRFKYDSWDLNVSDGTNLNRSQAVLAFAHWNKNIFLARIRHNGTGTFQNYTIPSPLYSKLDKLYFRFI